MMQENSVANFLDSASYHFNRASHTGGRIVHDGYALLEANPGLATFSKVAIVFLAALMGMKQAMESGKQTGGRLGYAGAAALGGLMMGQWLITHQARLAEFDDAAVETATYIARPIMGIANLSSNLVSGMANSNSGIHRSPARDAEAMPNLPPPTAPKHP